MAFHSPFYIFYLAFRINEMRFWAHYLFVLGILQTSNSLIVLKSFDASVSFMEGRTAYLNWNANFSEVGETWFSVKIERAKETTVNSPKEVVVKKFVQSGTVKETLYLTSRAADIALNISSMSSNVNITFLLRNVNPTTDDMYYICTVSSNTGNTELNSVWLLILVPSSCKIHPDKNITINETDNVLLNVITTGNPPVYEYIWTHPNGSSLTANSTLTFTASRQDNGTYKVSVYNGVGDRSICKRHITVQFPSSCTIHPDATTVKETDNVLLNVTTTGYPPVYEYIWTHPNGSRLTANSRLTFTASRQDTGTYKVSVYNGFGDRSICTSNVTVQYPPVAVTSKLVIIENYQNGSINCSAPGEPEPTFSWTSTTNRTPLTKDNGRTVVLINATLEDTGNYTCTAKNSLGDSSRTSSVIVAYPVGCTISPDLPNVIVNESGSVTLTCFGKGQPPVNEFSWTYPNGTTHPGTSVLQYRASRTDKKIYHCLVRNSLGRSGNCTRKVTVHYFKRNICSELNFNLVSGSGSQNLSAANPTGFGNPIPILTCVGAQVVVSNSKSIITVNTTVPKNVSCTFINKVGNCFRDITVWKRVPAYKKKSTMQILGMDFNIDLKDNNTQAFIALSKKIKTAILEVYRISGNKYVINIYVITFVEGSVWVNFELELIANVPNPLQPLQDALVQNKGNLSGLMVNESSLSEGFEKPKTSSTTTPTAAPTPTTTESSTPIRPTFWEKYRGYIIGAIIGVLVLIGLLLVIWWRYRKKRIEKNPALVNNNNATGDIHAVEGAQARDNAAYSTSDYADRGPSHAEGGKDEPAYAAVDMTKKTKKKKPEEKKKELTYAALEDFQPPGGRGGIVLEPLPKGQHTKMPEKYEDTIYAKIVGTKKPASGNQNAAGASNNIPLADMHVQGTETESEPSDQTADPAKQNDHNRPATNKKEKPPDNQGQPPTKEDSGKEESDSAKSSVTKL
ncbi:immunoglobulin superfamily member 10-like [Actinia tenebrosa]|uniref:Immunoglobulin superfamily member 10-like n=1 Tax=Actinia tenebrosa TaxID=6105 RepID=A0A6P8HGN9_ACTTE|nr:immunoglobulin superfamily member 10-like [Actinia tenebrosa]